MPKVATSLEVATDAEEEASNLVDEVVTGSAEAVTFEVATGSLVAAAC